MKGDAFDGYTNTTFSLVNNATQIKVEGTNGSSQPVAATLPVTDNRIRLLGTVEHQQALPGFAPSTWRIRATTRLRPR